MLVMRLVLFWATTITMLTTIYMVFIWAPIEINQGLIQKAFYFHVPMAWVAFLAFFIVFISGIGYLITRKNSWDQLAFSAAEIGVLFTTLVLITGSIWAKPTWGVWWQWEPRLTTSLILWIIYIAYLMLRAYSPSSDQAARYAAVLGIIGFIDVPIVYFSVVWWRNIHPLLMGPLSEEGSELAGSMVITLNVGVLTFTLLFAYLLVERYRLRRREEEVIALHARYGEGY